jgi:BirA family biotin operon repressor/biotin-[acetyl-CoA-carboxylase] ligase
VDVKALDARLGRLREAGLIDGGSVQRARVVSRLRGGGIVSGERVAEALGVSRAAVSKHARAMMAAGLGLTAVPRLGYALSEWGWADSLLPEVMVPRLLEEHHLPDPGCSRGAEPRVCLEEPESSVLGIPYLYRAEVGSTNDVLRAEAEAGLPGGALAVTEAQRKGRGRLGRSWVSQPGKDLAFSLLIRPAVPAALIHFAVVAAGLAAAQAVCRLAPEIGTAVGVKWPNDVMVGGRKVCGVLTEGSVDMDVVHWVAMGVGLNVNGDPCAYVLEGEREDAPLPASLQGETGREFPRGDVLLAFLSELRPRLALLEQRGTTALLEELRSRDVLVGRPVTVRRGVGSRVDDVRGIADGFREDGALMVRTEDGGRMALVGGEVTLRPSAG